MRCSRSARLHWRLLITLAGRRADTATLLLAGLAISLAAGAATSLALALAPSPFAFYDAYDWLMGNFADRSLAQAAVGADPRRRRGSPAPAAGPCARPHRARRRRRRVAGPQAPAAGAGGHLPCPPLLSAPACRSRARSASSGWSRRCSVARLSRGHPGRAMLPAAADRCDPARHRRPGRSGRPARPADPRRRDHRPVRHAPVRLAGGHHAAEGDGMTSLAARQIGNRRPPRADRLDVRAGRTGRAGRS